ncbi:MAG: YiiG family protein [Nannocystaceae bacterium]|nr:YiiG family protein [Nannocystaceae bacterium]
MSSTDIEGLYASRFRNSARVFVAVAASLVCVGGCDMLTNAVQQQAEAAGQAAVAEAEARIQAEAEARENPPMKEDERLGKKLSGYIGCINSLSKRVQDSEHDYWSWVDREKGVTGKESSPRGPRTVFDSGKCHEAVEASATLEPSLPDLEAAGKAYVAAFDVLKPLVKDAHTYYNEEDFKDDDFAKGKALHPKLDAAWTAFNGADVGLRAQIKAQNELLQARELLRIEKEEGRKLRFLSKNVMAEANKYVVAAHSEPFDSLDLASLTAAATAYESALEEANTYAEAHKEEAGSLAGWNGFFLASTRLRKQGKTLARRKRDGQPWTERELQMLSRRQTVEGHPTALTEKFNALIKESNRFDWSRYKPS